MTHHPLDQIPLSAAHTGAAGDGGPGFGREAAPGALGVYDRHGEALFSLALLLCRDPETAADAVVATVALSHRSPDADAGPDTERRRLAADLWCRCVGEPAAPEPATPSDGSSAGQEDALLGLVLFGCHTYAQAAALIGVPAPVAAVHLRSVLRRAAKLPTGRTA